MTIGLGDLQGLWRRTLLTAPGIEDRETRVFWAQGQRLHADLRVPASGAAGPAALLGCEGFAGETRVENGLCTWHRRINWRGPVTGPDIGRLSWQEPGRVLIEAGVHADYAETWVRDDEGPVSTALHAAPDGQRAYLIWSDSFFVLGRGDPAALSGPPLAERTHDGAAFDQAYTLGRWEGAVGIATLSTQPHLTGEPVVERTAHGLGLRRDRATGPDWQVWPAV